MQKSSMENNQWKINEKNTDFCFKPIARSGDFTSSCPGEGESGIRRAMAPRVSWFSWSDTWTEKKGPEKRPSQPQKIYKNIFKYKSSGVPRKRKPCWILLLKIFRTQSSNLMFLWVELD